MSNIKQTIVDSIKYTTDTLGWTLIKEDWGLAKHKCTCALGCVLLKHNPQDVVILEEDRENTAAAADVLGVTSAWVDAFIEGFDGSGTAEQSKEPEAWKLGAEIAQDTDPPTLEEVLEEMEEDG